MSGYLIGLGVLVLVGIVVLALRRPRRGRGSSVETGKPRQLPDGVEPKKLVSDNKKLTGENARQWLDDFLRKQQS